MKQNHKKMSCLSKPPSPEFFRESLERVKIPLPLYQTADGDTTTDVTLALKDPFGKPICVGHSAKEYTFAPPAVKPLCLDPADPTERLRAIEARARMEQVFIEPTIYDTFLQIRKYNAIYHSLSRHSLAVGSFTYLDYT